MNILHLTTIIPAPLSTKARENDILMRLAQEYEKKYPGSRHHFIFIAPYSNWFFAFFKKKWKEYREIIKKGSFEAEGYEITVLGIPGFRKNNQKLRKLLTWLGYILLFKRIKRTIAQIKPDIIHAQNMHSNIELAELIRKKYGINYLVTARNIDQSVLNRIHKGLLKPAAIISHNHISAERCKDLGIPVNIIPHPVDGYFFRNEISISTSDQHKLKIVSACSLLKLKNIHRVIEALYQLNIDFSYTIIGDGPEKENLEALAGSYLMNESISFMGFISHEAIARMLGGFDLFIMPSYPETLGRVYFEAMASGVPVIASKNTGIDGMIEHLVQGYLVDHNSEDEIKDAVQHFMSLSQEKKLQMKKNAIDFARQFTWDVVLMNYYRAYND